MQGNHAEIGLPRQLLRSFSVTVKYSAELVHGDYEDLDNPGASVPITVTASQEDPATQDPDADQPSDPDTDTDPVEIPDSDNPIANTPAAKKRNPRNTLGVRGGRRTDFDDALCGDSGRPLRQQKEIVYFRFSGFRHSSSGTTNSPSLRTSTPSKYISPPP